MPILASLCVALTFGAVISDASNNFNKPITIVVSRKIWDLLEKNAHIVNAAGTAITLPELYEKKGVRQYLTWNGRLDHLSLEKSNASFQEYKNGVHLRMSAQYHGNMKARVKAFFVPEATGVIRLKSESAVIDVVLRWNDFSFAPNVSVHSNVSVDFDNQLWRIDFLTSKIQEMVTSKVNSEIRHMIVDAVERQLNPILRKLKQKMVSTGSTQYEIEWAVRDNRLLVGIKPKNWKEGITYPNTNDSTMLCLKGMMPALIRDSQNRVERAAATNGTDFTCVAPKFDCEQTSCSVCADVDLVVSSGSTDMQLCDIRREDNVGEALTLTISPKIWNLLDRNAHIINRAVTSIKIPDIGGLLPLIRYRVDNGRINYFHVPKRDVSFYDYKGGVRWTMNLRFEATTHAKIFVVWIFPIFGKIIAKSEFAYLDVKLLWNNFKLTPYISMHSKINIEFTHGLKFFLSFLRGTVANKVSSAINTKVPVMINEAIERHVNPRLQKLKQKLISNNYTNYDIDWQVRGKHFRVVVKPRSRNGVESALKPIEHMMCVDLNVLDVIGEASKVMKKAANNSSTVTASPVMGINGIDFTCVNPKFNCEGSSCSLCTDVDFNLALLSYADKFRDCLPRS